MFQPYRGMTFVGKLVDSEPTEHLHIVLTHPFAHKADEEQVLLVNISSIPTDKPYIKYDKTCILHEDDHSFIKRDSYVYYQRCMLYSADELANKLQDSGKFAICETIKSDVLDRICDGLKKQALARRPKVSHTEFDFYNQAEIERKKYSQQKE